MEVDLLPGTGTSAGELAVSLVRLAIAVAVAVASYRRCRCLSRYPVWRSVLVAAVAGTWWTVWLILWWVNRERIAAEWEQQRRERDPSPVVVG